MEHTRNLTLLTDLYELTMSYGYYRHNMHNEEAVFDMYFRNSVGKSVYAIVAGLEQVIEYVQNLHFDENDIQYLREFGLFDEEFLEYLSQMRFTGEIYAMREGEVAFAEEPLLRIKAPIIQAQIMETAILNIVNHQTLIATKASRVVYAAQGDGVLEFGLRRAQGPDAGIYGARAAIIGGCIGTSNVLCGKMFGVSVKGTHAHSWVMSFDSEIEAFRGYANTFPHACLLLVDTYDTLLSGVPNAIKVFEELRERGYKPLGIRLDSGDLAYLSIKARAMLDEAGFPDVLIFASNDLDEYVIRALKTQGAKIDVWGVGTSMITSRDNPALGGVYKLVAHSRDGHIIPKIKISDNPEKITTPGYKKIWRLYDSKNDKAIADYMALETEEIDTTESLTIFDPNAIWKKTTLTNYYTKELLVPIFVEGELVYDCPNIDEIRQYAIEGLDTLWDGYKRLTNPHVYKVDYSQELFDLKNELLAEATL